MADGAASNPVLEVVSYEFTAPDGPEAEWRVHQLRMIEALDEDYSLELDVVTADVDVDTNALLGASVELMMARGESYRMVYGIATEVEYLGRWHKDLMVRLRIVPAFTLLRQRVASRIFQEMTVQEIISEVLDEGFGDYERTFEMLACSRGTATRDYCVQYHESDHDFVRRLLEEEGISFHFAHDEGKGHEVLVLTDAGSQLQAVVNTDSSEIVPIVVTRPDLIEVESIRGLEWRRALAPTSTLRTDYDWLVPTQPLSDPKGEVDARGRERRVYTHMRRRYITDDVAERAQDHLDALRLHHQVGTGEGNATIFTAGYTFELDRHVDLPELEGRHLITRVVHEGSCPEELVGGSELDSGTVPRYRNVFECIPADTPVRPRVRTPKPLVHGPQTAIVVGSSGEEIETDEHGCIKVQFHWEEDGAYDETSSCWVRVSQSWAGPGWGAQFIPRIGMEVVVEFLEGNPDRPLVTGCVYNGDNAPPFALPDNKTQSGIRTDSSIGDGFNELRFEDGAGMEEIYIRAQKDKTIEVKHDHSRTVDNDETIHVKHDRTKTVDNDQSETIGNDKTIAVKGNHTEEVDGDYTETIGGAHAIEIGKTRSLKVSEAWTEEIGGDKTVDVSGAHDETVGGARSMSVSDTLTMESGGDLSGKTDAAMNLESGAAMGLKAGGALSIEGSAAGAIELATELVIKVGGAKVTLKSGGAVEIECSELKVQASGAIKLQGGSIKLN